MNTITITRRFTFCASHRLHSKHMSDARNVEIYNKCNNKNGHGHNYVLNISLKGTVDPITGMLINFSELDKIVQHSVIDIFDHKNLDLDTPYFDESPSTSENIAIVIWNILAKTKLLKLMYSIELIETEKNRVIYYGTI